MEDLTITIKQGEKTATIRVFEQSGEQRMKVDFEPDFVFTDQSMFAWAVGVFFDAANADTVYNVE